MKRFVFVALAALFVGNGHGFAFERMCPVLPLFPVTGGWLHQCDGFSTPDCSDFPEETYEVFPEELFAYDCSSTPTDTCLVGDALRAANGEPRSFLHPPLARKIQSFGEPGAVHRMLAIDPEMSGKIRFTHLASNRNGGKDELVYIRTLHLRPRVGGRSLTIGWEYKPEIGEPEPLDVTDRVVSHPSQRFLPNAYLFRYTPVEAGAKAILLVKHVPQVDAR